MRSTLVLVLVLLSGTAEALRGQQACDCKLGKIAAYDIDMRPLPAAANQAEQLRQRALITLSGQFRGRVWANDACGDKLTRTDANIDAASNTLSSGASRNVAPAGPVSGLEYLFAGEMTLSGEAYVVTVRLEAARNRKVVRAASVTIPIVVPDPAVATPISAFNETVLLVSSAAEALAAQFQPVGGRITEWERSERAADPGVARSYAGGTLTLKPERSKLRTGESISVQLRLTDCDGQPLGNRRVNFGAGNWKTLGRMDGTTGGTVSPQTVTTGADGEATVQFTATMSRGTAVVRAWYGHDRPCGEPYALTGAASVVVEPPPVEPRPAPEPAPGGAGGWQGTVTVITSKHLEGKSPDGKPFVEDGAAQLECLLVGRGEDAVCNFESKGSTTGNGASIAVTKKAAGYETSVSISVRGGKLYLGTAVIPVEGTQTVTVAGQTFSDKIQDNITNETYVVPAGADPNRLSGQWTDPNPVLAQLGGKVMVSWSLTRR